MKQIQSACLLCSAVFLIVLSSCKGSGDKKAVTDTTSTTKDNSITPATPGNIVTTPQGMVTVVHKVADYAKWKAAYDADDANRLANGLHSYVIGRGYPDSMTVLVAMKADDMAKAKAFAQNPALKDIMQKAGVLGTPEMTFLTATWQDTANIGPLPRVRTTLTVKDWNTWLTQYEGSAQERADNGIVSRLVGHDADDDKKVALVTAITDTAKAFAYYKSDKLKKRIEASGVTKGPERFIFTIVAKY